MEGCPNETTDCVFKANYRDAWDQLNAMRTAVDEQMVAADRMFDCFNAVRVRKLLEIIKKAQPRRHA